MDQGAGLDQGEVQARRRRKALACAAAAVGLLLVLVAQDAAARTVFVAGFESDTISLIDSQVNHVVGTAIPLTGAGPFELAITPDGSRAYVADNKTKSVSVIDTRTDLPVGAPIEVGKEPLGVAITPDGGRAYVANGGSKSVSVIDTATNAKVGGPIEVGEFPDGVAITPDGTRVYVTNKNSGNVSVINTGTNQVIGTISVESGPLGLAVTPDGSRIYVANSNSENVSVIDTATNAKVGGPIKVGKEPSYVAITPDGTRVLVSNTQSNTLSVIDTQNNQLLPGIAGIKEAEFIAIAPGGKTAYVSSFAPGTVTAVDLQTNQVLGAPIEVGKGAGRVAITPDQPPAAAFSTLRARPGVPTTFDASASTDPDGTVTTFAWAFGDGKAASLSKPKTSHVYRAPGAYSASLTLTDNEACSTSFIFTGQTATCAGSALATKALVVKVTFPGVRVRCPKGAKPGGCRFKLQAISKVPRNGRKAKAQSALARANVKPGKSAIVSLKPRKAFRVRLARDRSVLVRETGVVGGSHVTRFRRLKIVQ